MRHFGPRVKKNDNLAPDTYTPDEENALLFQLSDELILEDAAQYGSWQEWQQASEAEGIGNISSGSDTIQGSIPDDVIGWEREEWYEDTWNRAHERRREKAAGGEDRVTMSEAKQRFTARLKDDTELERFLSTMGAIIRDDYNETAGDAEEAAARYAAWETKEKIEREAHPRVVALAKRAAKGKELDGSSLEAARTIIERGARTYLDIYAAVMEDEEYRGYAETAVEDDKHEAAAAKQEGLTAYERIRLAKRLKNTELAEKIQRGEATLQELEEYAAAVEEELKEAQKAIQESETAAAQWEAQYNAEAELRAETGARLHEREVEVEKQKKEIARLEHQKKEIRCKQKERDALKKLVAENKRIMKRVLESPSAQVDLHEAEKIRAVQETIRSQINPAQKGKKVTIDGKAIAVDEFRKRVQSGEIDIEFLDKRLKDRFMRRGINELTTAEVKELEAQINDLKAYGRTILRERQERQAAQSKRMLNNLIDEAEAVKAEGKTGAAKRAIAFEKAADEEGRKKVLKSTGAQRLFFTTLKDRNLAEKKTAHCMTR